MGQATEDVKTKNIVNGVNVDELLGTIASIKLAPIIGDFKLIASNKWVNGGLNRTTINKFYGAQ